MHWSIFLCLCYILPCLATYTTLSSDTITHSKPSKPTAVILAITVATTESVSSNAPTLSRNSSSTNGTNASTSIHNSAGFNHTHILTHTYTTTKYRPIPVPTRSPDPKPDSTGQSSPRKSHQSPIIIILEVFGGLIGFGFFLSFLRFLNSYRKTPGRDRIVSAVHRHQLEREMEELERQQRLNMVRRSSLIRPPPPPYMPPPPMYVSLPLSEPADDTEAHRRPDG